MKRASTLAALSFASLFAMPAFATTNAGKETPTIETLSGVAGLSFTDDAVDLVISGHTHQAYNCTMPNKDGRAIPVTSANTIGRVMTDTV